MKWWKVTLVIIGAVIITAFGIDAADTLTGSQGTLLSQVIQTGNGGCPGGMAQIENNASVTCVDTYEVSASESCSTQNPASISDSARNIREGDCKAESKIDALPWRFVTREQAMQACAVSGKRLPTSAEWYQLSLGMDSAETSCNVSSGQLAVSGKFDSCVSPNGTYDLVGNVWEWVSDDVIDGRYENRTLPETGYVAQVDSNGMPTLSTSTEMDLFGKDYFWSQNEGAFGVIRGGFYNSDSDAGIYIVHADTLPTTAGTAIGFRCVK